MGDGAIHVCNVFQCYGRGTDISRRGKRERIISEPDRYRVPYYREVLACCPCIRARQRDRRLIFDFRNREHLFLDAHEFHGVFRPPLQRFENDVDRVRVLRFDPHRQGIVGVCRLQDFREIFQWHPDGKRRSTRKCIETPTVQCERHQRNVCGIHGVDVNAFGRELEICLVYKLVNCVGYFLEGDGGQRKFHYKTLPDVYAIASYEVKHASKLRKYHIRFLQESMDVMIDKSADETVLEIPKNTGRGIEINMQQEPTTPAKPKPRPPATRPPPAILQRPKMNLPPPTRDTFMDFANPSKVSPLDADDDDDASELPEVPDDLQSASDASGDQQFEDDGYQVEEEEYEEVIKPSEGYRTLDEEKSAIMLKLYRYKRQGVPVPRNFSIGSDIREMRAELGRIRAEQDIESSIKFQRKCLMGIVTTMEFLNKRYDPFDLELDGWSEHVNDDLQSYDRVFERLHEKYKSKVSVAPEIELLMMVAGSAMMFHFTNSIFKQLPSGLGAGGGSMDPSVVANLMNSMMNGPAAGAPGGAPPPAQAPQATPPPSYSAENQEASGSRYEMRPPAFDISNLMGSVGAMPPPQMSNPPRERKVTFQEAPTSSKRPIEEDRLSDIVSEDLESVPDDLTSIGSGDGPKSIAVGGRGGKRAKTVARNVIKI